MHKYFLVRTVAVFKTQEGYQLLQMEVTFSRIRMEIILRSWEAVKWLQSET